MKDSKNEHILINILTRTSGRPNSFFKCYSSIQQQSYKHIRHIVSCDDNLSLNYLEGLDINTIKVEKEKPIVRQFQTDAEGNSYAPYNLYCNKMLELVDEGWVLFLDDDDHLYHDKVVEELVSEICIHHNEDTLFIWQMRYPNGRVLPSNDMIRNQTILKNNIGSPCFLFHFKYKHQVYWDAFKTADFRFLEQLNELIPNKVWLRKLFVQINNYGDLGKRNDIKTYNRGQKIMPVVFYKNISWYFLPKYHMQVFGFYLFHKKSYKKYLLRFKKFFNCLKLVLHSFILF